ncbi:hypothetical protein ABK040_000597 [Willaertia magna]
MSKSSSLTNSHHALQTRTFHCGNTKCTYYHQAFDKLLIEVKDIPNIKFKCFSCESLLFPCECCGNLCLFPPSTMTTTTATNNTNDNNTSLKENNNQKEQLENEEKIIQFCTFCSFPNIYQLNWRNTLQLDNNFIPIETIKFIQMQISLTVSGGEDEFVKHLQTLENRFQRELLISRPINISSAKRWNLNYFIEPKKVFDGISFKKLKSLYSNDILEENVENLLFNVEKYFIKNSNLFSLLNKTKMFVISSVNINLITQRSIIELFNNQLNYLIKQLEVEFQIIYLNILKPLNSHLLSILNSLQKKQEINVKNNIFSLFNFNQTNNNLKEEELSITKEKLLIEKFEAWRDLYFNLCFIANILSCFSN